MRHWRVYGHRADRHGDGSDAHNRIAHWDDPWDHAGWTRGREWRRRLDDVSGGADWSVDGHRRTRGERWQRRVRGPWGTWSPCPRAWWRYLTRWATTLR